MGLEERRVASAGDLVDSLPSEGPPGARGSSFPSSLLNRSCLPPCRTDATSQPSVSSSLPLPPPPPSLSAELLELGDSLMKLGSVTQEQLGALTAPHSSEPAYGSCSHRPDQNALSTPYVLDHIAITDPRYDSKDHSHSYSSAYLPEAASSALERSGQSREHVGTYDGSPKSERSYQPCPERGSSYTAEHPATYALKQSPTSEPQPSVQLCLPSPELEPELLLSPVIPPGGPFSPSDPQSLEPLDPAASAQLLDNIMAWFNNNINPQNNPQSLALIPSPPTTETDSSPDTHTEADSQNPSDGSPAPIWQPLEGEPEAAPHSTVGPEDARRFRSRSEDRENRIAGGRGSDPGCATDMSLGEARTHLSSHSHCGNSPAHTASAADGALEPVLQLERSRPSEEWEEQEHLV